MRRARERALRATAHRSGRASPRHAWIPRVAESAVARLLLILPDGVRALVSGAGARTRQMIGWWQRSCWRPVWRLLTTPLPHRRLGSPMGAGTPGTLLARARRAEERRREAEQRRRGARRRRYVLVLLAGATALTGTLERPLTSATWTHSWRSARRGPSSDSVAIVAALLRAHTARPEPARARAVAHAVALVARRERLSLALLTGLVQVENPDLDSTATSIAGARGILQIMPMHAGQLGCGSADLARVVVNVCHGARLLRGLLVETGGDTARALLRYNGCVRGSVTPGCDRYPGWVMARAHQAALALAHVQRRADPAPGPAARPAPRHVALRVSQAGSALAVPPRSETSALTRSGSHAAPAPGDVATGPFTSHSAN